jgi:GDP-4-dehydro-6-deoxy-D-mannose reductase
MSSGSPILVTGALGFAGCWLVGDLLADGLPVIGCGRLPAAEEAPLRCGPYTRRQGARDAAGGVIYEVGDSAGAPAAAVGRTWTFYPCALEVPDAVAEILGRLRPGTIYHLAAQSSAGRSFGDPLDTFASNLTGTLHLLEAVRALPPAERPVLLAVGSGEEYGAPPGRRDPFGERSPLAPVSPYGVSKAAQTLLCQQYHRSSGLPVVVARAFSHTGPGHDTRFVFPSFARQIVAAERGEQAPILQVGDLSPIRDYLDVRDVVRAYRLLAARGEPGQVYNVCSGRALTIRDGLEILLREARRAFEIVSDPARCRPADIPYLVGDGTKLRARTGWRPEHPLQATLCELLNWTRKEMA